MKPCSSSLLFLYVGLLLLVTLTHGEDAGSRNKYINVGVVSSWDATPFHMEARYDDIHLCISNMFMHAKSHNINTLYISITRQPS